jgi:hypothetical protein
VSELVWVGQELAGHADGYLAVCFFGEEMVVVASLFFVL